MFCVGSLVFTVRNMSLSRHQTHISYQSPYQTQVAWGLWCLRKLIVVDEGTLAKIKSCTS